MNQITIMLLVPDRARADVMLRADRAYYRFATPSASEDGDIPGLGESLEVFGNRILEAIRPLDGETPIPECDLQMRLFVDNVERQASAPLTEQAIRRLGNMLTAHNESLEFFTRF